MARWANPSKISLSLDSVVNSALNNSRMMVQALQLLVMSSNVGWDSDRVLAEPLRAKAKFLNTMWSDQILAAAMLSILLINSLGAMESFSFCPQNSGSFVCSTFKLIPHLHLGPLVHYGWEPSPSLSTGLTGGWAGSAIFVVLVLLNTTAKHYVLTRTIVLIRKIMSYK